MPSLFHSFSVHTIFFQLTFLIDSFSFISFFVFVFFVLVVFVFVFLRFSVIFNMDAFIMRC